MGVIFKKKIFWAFRKEDNRLNFRGLYLISLFSILVLFLGSCQVRPEACFGFKQKDRLSGSALISNLPVQFSNCSIEAEHFQWDFGDGTFSTEKDPFHTYDTAGVYEVKLQVGNRNRTAEFIQWVTIQAPSAEDVIIGNWSANQIFEVIMYPNQWRDTIVYPTNDVIWIFYPNYAMTMSSFPGSGNFSWRFSNNQLQIDSLLYQVDTLNFEALKISREDTITSGLPIMPQKRTLYLHFKKGS
jgi:hypothetical protein